MSSTPDSGQGGKQPNDPPAFSQDIQLSNVAARVSEKVARGVFSTGVLVLQTQSEFVLDFVQGLARPHQVAARVVAPVVLLPQLIAALRENLEIYRQKFGPPPAQPASQPPTKPPSVEEIYANLKISEEIVSGTYANAALLTHSAAEFCMDFVANFYPKASVSARVFLSAAQAPVLLSSLVQAWQRYEASQQLPKKPAAGGLRRRATAKFQRVCVFGKRLRLSCMSHRTYRTNEAATLQEVCPLSEHESCSRACGPQGAT